MRKCSITSNGSQNTLPPLARTLSTLASQSATLKYTPQCGGTPAATMSAISV